jgi:hypothetical protein
MDLERVFYILKKRKRISKNKLYECGVSDDFLKQLIDNEILTPINDHEYKIDSVDETFYYAKYLLEEKKYSLANAIFTCCYVTDPTNFNVNYQLFYRALKQNNNDNVFKHFDVVYETLKENDREADANYYLYLLGTLFGVPEKYIGTFNDLEIEDILLDEVDGFSMYENSLRKEVFSNSYFDVNKMLDERFEGDREDLSFEDMVEKELLLKWLVKNRNFNKMIVSYLNEDKIREVKSLLDSEDEKRFLTITNQHLLKLVNSYLTIEETGVVVEPKYNGDNVFEAINGNNYELAIKLVEKHMEDHHIEKTSLLLVMLKKITKLIYTQQHGINLKPLIEAVEEMRNRDNLKPLIDAVEEVRSKKTISLSDREIQSLNSKIKKLYEGRSLFLLEPMSKEKRDLVIEYVSGFEDINAFTIGKDDEKRLVLRYKPYVKEYVSIFDTATEAKRLYRRGKYQEAASLYELLLKIGKPRDVTYGMYGLTLLKLHRKNEALDYLKIATILSKEFNGKLDYTDIIEGIEYPQDKENRKPKVVVKEEEFGDNSTLDDTLINDIIGLCSEGEISLLDACKRLNLSEEDTNYIKLLYARDCYYLDRTKEGDLYFKQVEKSKAKDKRVKDLFKEILLNKKYYHNRLDTDKSQIVFIKK